MPKEYHRQRPTHWNFQSGVYYCPQVASEHIKENFRTGEVTGDGASSLGMETPGLKGLWRKAEVQHQVTKSESLKRLWVKVRP